MLHNVCLGDKGWKILSVGHCIFYIFDNSSSRKNKGLSGEKLLRGYTIAIITAHPALPVKLVESTCVGASLISGCSQFWQKVCIGQEIVDYVF